MRRTKIRIAALGFIVVLVASPAQAQFPIFGPLIVYDPSNYAQAVAQVTNLIRQYAWMVNQARRLPASMSRYVVPEIRWRTHDFQVGFPWARPALTGLNYGDPAGSLYLQVVDRLDVINDILPKMPMALRQRLINDYATIELADSIAQMGIHQAGAIRFNGRRVLEAIQEMENDAIAASDTYHTQTALLNKINGTSVLGLRIAERSTQFLMHTLEQLLVDNKRKRDSEAKLMNAVITQWRYGQDYGSDLFASTAANLDTWRQY